MASSWIRRARVAAVVASALGATWAATVAAQPPVWTAPGFDNYPTPGAAAPTGLLAFAPQLKSAPTDAAPLARIVRNPDESSGLPPYALTDHSGTIQRYVEPVAGIDLEPFIGSVVRVRHDTGRTLLASQLELPLRPTRANTNLSREKIGRAPARAAITPQSNLPGGRSTKRAKAVEAVEYVDNDDASVQLLADTEELLPEGHLVGSSSAQGEVVQPLPAEGGPGNLGFSEGTSVEEMPPPGMRGQTSADGMMMSEGNSMYGGPMDMGMPGMEMEHGGGMEGGWGECPECENQRMPFFGGAENDWQHGGEACGPQGRSCRYYADVQLNFLRAHVMENFAGKLSEKYELSPRVVVGWERQNLIDGRARYWHYGRNTPVLTGGEIRIEFDVVDLEATRTVALGNSAVLVAAGLRTARIDLEDFNGGTAGCDLLGATVAGDFHTLLCRVREGELVGVARARMSILAGDWGQNGRSIFVPNQLQDDNVVVDELYAGLAYERCCRKANVHFQLGFEMQNWHSDVLAQNARGDSLSFIGPGLEIGASY